jgi:hypothetical protein
LHLNLPGAPDGAAFSGEHIISSIVPGRRVMPFIDGQRYFAAVDMSGGSNDDAVLSITHREDRRVVLDLIESQNSPCPFNPRHAVAKFGNILRQWKITHVVGDAYAGQTFRADFEALGIQYTVSERSKHEYYEALEPLLTANELELLDAPKLQEQMLTLVWRGAKIDHLAGDHDDWADSCARACVLASGGELTDLEVWTILGSQEPWSLSPLLRPY